MFLHFLPLFRSVSCPSPTPAAHVGVGIAGVEGGQAVQNADFALSQFRFLQRLLLVHGRWSYMRISLFLRYFLFKTCGFALVHVWFDFFNGFSAQVRLTLMKFNDIQTWTETKHRENILHLLSLSVLQSLYETWFIAFYTVSYTAFPVMLVAFFEQVRQFKLCIFLWSQLSSFWYLLVFSHNALCCRTWVQKAAWSGRSCTSLDRDRNSPALSCCPCPSCMPSTHHLFTSLSHLESSTTQPLTTRPWQSLSQWQPRLLPPLRSGLQLLAMQVNYSELKNNKCIRNEMWNRRRNVTNYYYCLIKT